ncbi:MAG: DUF4870 domain-containing protein [Bryobacterales bacterium]|nr:DUF4870 domain-containing protein [Bryobacterales bacterium]
MPYCCQCGKGVGSHDAYCGVCGARQPGASGAPPPIDYLPGIRPRTAALLCYIPILGWIVSIVVLASARFRADGRVRFHAFQGLYLFVAWLLVDWVLGPMLSFDFVGAPFHHILPGLLKALIFVTWIFMMVKTSQDEMYKLPILGDLAEKSVSEQR